MKCVKSNVILKVSDRQLGVSLDLAVKTIKDSFMEDNYPYEDPDVDDQIELEKVKDKDWDRSSLMM